MERGGGSSVSQLSAAHLLLRDPPGGGVGSHLPQGGEDHLATGGQGDQAVQDAGLGVERLGRDGQEASVSWSSASTTTRHTVVAPSAN